MMLSATSSTTPAGGTSQPRMSSRHSSRGPMPIITPTSPATATATTTTTTSRRRPSSRHSQTRSHRPPRRRSSRAFSKPPSSATAPKSLSVDRPSRKCGAHTAWGSSPSATCRPFRRYRLPCSFLMPLRRLPRLIRVKRWHSRRGRGRGRGVVGWCRTGTGTRRHRPRRGCSIRRRSAIRRIRLLRRVAGARAGAAVGGGASRHGHEHGSAHGNSQAQASSGYSNASYSSYAS
jgi:hypothetical protein